MSDSEFKKHLVVCTRLKILELATFRAAQVFF